MVPYDASNDETYALDMSPFNASDGSSCTGSNYCCVEAPALSTMYQIKVVHNGVMSIPLKHYRLVRASRKCGGMVEFHCPCTGSHGTPVQPRKMDRRNPNLITRAE